ncbi:hypothetical protein [Pseudomonas cremoricolorata]|uniref:hypothetical protein n=1 Tax=Pseudomonas cremoricolorata TaxID=157783 RepID=UPI00040C100F|nr:hypothetical protein [Pseudomonas cremoricolorata]
MNLKKVAAGDEPVAAVPARVTFTDTTYTSRSLFLQQGDTLRQFDVVAQRLSVAGDDAEGLAFLESQSELQRLGS